MGGPGGDWLGWFNVSPENGSSYRKPMAPWFRVTAFIIFIVTGIYGLISLSIHSYDLAVYYSGSEPKGTWPFNTTPAVVILVTFYSTLFVASVLGGAGVKKDSRNTVFCSLLLLFGTGVIMFIFGVVIIHQSQVGDNNLKEKVMQYLNEGRIQDYMWLNNIQGKHECCGLSLPKDWIKIDLQARKSFNLSRNSAPSSCCITKGDENNSTCGNGVFFGTADDSWKKVLWTKTCGSVVFANMRDSLIFMGLEILLGSLVTLVITVFLYCGAAELFCFSKCGVASPTIANGINRATDEGVSQSSANTDDEDEFSTDRLGDMTSNISSSTNGRIRRARVRLDARGNVRMGNPFGPNANKNTRITVPKFRSRSKPRGLPPKSPRPSDRGKVTRDSETQDNTDKDNNEKNNKPTNNGTGVGADIKSEQFILQKLYEGVNKNLSALSTTPNPSGSVCFPFTTTKRPSNDRRGSPPPQNTQQQNSSSSSPPRPPVNPVQPRMRGTLAPIMHSSSVPQIPHHLYPYLATGPPQFIPQQRRIVVNFPSDRNNTRTNVVLQPPVVHETLVMMTLPASSSGPIPTAVKPAPASSPSIGNEEADKDKSLDKEKDATSSIPEEAFPAVEVKNAVKLILDDLGIRDKGVSVSSEKNTHSDGSFPIPSTSPTKSPTEVGCRTPVRVVSPSGKSDHSLGFDTSTVSTSSLSGFLPSPQRDERLLLSAIQEEEEQDGENDCEEDKEEETFVTPSSSDIQDNNVGFFVLPTIVEEPEVSNDGSKPPSDEDITSGIIFSQAQSSMNNATATTDNLLL